MIMFNSYDTLKIARSIRDFGPVWPLNGRRDQLTVNTVIYCLCLCMCNFGKVKRWDLGARLSPTSRAGALTSRSPSVFRVKNRTRVKYPKTWHTEFSKTMRLLGPLDTGHPWSFAAVSPTHNRTVHVEWRASAENIRITTLPPPDGFPLSVMADANDSSRRTSVKTTKRVLSPLPPPLR